MSAPKPQTMGQRGIQSGADLLMLRTMGGYKGGGASGVQQALLNLEEMGTDFKAGGVGGLDMGSRTAKLMRQVIEMSGGGAGGEMSLMNFMNRRGIQMSTRESMLLGKRLRGGSLSEDEQRMVDAEDERRKQGMGEAGRIGSRDALGSAARKAINKWGSSVKKQAEIQNKQLEVGGKVVGAVLALEESSTNISNTFSTLVKGPLKEFSQSIEWLTSMINNRTTTWMTGG